MGETDSKRKRYLICFHYLIADASRVTHSRPVEMEKEFYYGKQVGEYTTNGSTI
jgi:hypothetical protein